VSARLAKQLIKCFRSVGAATCLSFASGLPAQCIAMKSRRDASRLHDVDEQPPDHGAACRPGNLGLPSKVHHDRATDESKRKRYAHRQ